LPFYFRPRRVEVFDASPGPFSFLGVLAALILAYDSDSVLIEYAKGKRRTKI